MSTCRLSRLLFIVFFLLQISNSVEAQPNVKIKVKINDKIITNIDIQKEAQYLKILNSISTPRKMVCQKTLSLLQRRMMRATIG